MRKHKTEEVTFIEQNIGFLLPLLLMLGDYIGVIVAEETAMFARMHSFFTVEPMQISWVNQWFAIPMIYILFMHVEKLYKRRAQFWQIIPMILHSCNYSILSVIVLMYAAHVSATTSRLFVGLLWVFSFIFITLIRFVIRKILRNMGMLQLPVIVAGAGEAADALVRGILDDEGMGYKVVGLLTDIKPVSKRLKSLPILGKLEDYEAVINRTGVSTVMIAISGKDHNWLDSYINKIQLLVKDVVYVPNMMSVPMGGLEVEGLFDEKIVLLKMKNNLTRPLNVMLKVVFDYILTFVGIILISPILLFIAWKIHKDSPGPIIYDGERIGLNGKMFKCYKFRSMYTNGDEILAKYLKDNPEAAEQWRIYHKLDDDPRVTPIGKFIRKTSIDELPQLFNVLCGDMSLVGARPYMLREKQDMGIAYNTIILAKPGITGYWQVNGRSDVDFAGRVKMDCWYICNWSIWMDISLLYKTVWIVLNQKGAK